MDAFYALIFIAFALISLAIYFAPWLVAHDRGHLNQGAIFVLNLCLGWTLIGWVAALVWACTKQTPHDEAPVIEPPALRKPCPYCAEPILATAIKCKHCGSSLLTNPRDFV